MRKYSNNISKKLIVCIIALMVTLVSGCAFIEPARVAESGNLEVTFVDVDQGDATFIKTDMGETVLVDGGEYEIYETHLAPFLEDNGISQVDYAVVTHYHSDHMGGIFELVKAGGARTLVLPDYGDTDNTKASLEEVAEETGTEVQYISAGGFIETKSQELKIEAIHPQQGGSEGSNFHNNSSLVLRVTYGSTNLLVTGDIESRVERELAETEQLECDILKVAHHGSSSSSHKKFLEAADPTYAIISVGADNSYGHPHNEVLERYENDDVRVYRTDIDGSITFVISPQKIEDIKYSK